jgi:hypothetical protein
LDTGTRSEQVGISTKAGLLPETEAEEVHDGWISLDAPQGIGEKPFPLQRSRVHAEKIVPGGKKQIPIRSTVEPALDAHRFQMSSTRTLSDLLQRSSRA